MIRWLGSSAFAFALVCAALVFGGGCVTRTSVCVTADRATGRATYEAPPRSTVGASVCVDVEPPTR